MWKGALSSNPISYGIYSLCRLFVKKTDREDNEGMLLWASGSMQRY